MSLRFYNFVGSTNTEFGYVYAAALISMLPIVAIYLLDAEHLRGGDDLRQRKGLRGKEEYYMDYPKFVSVNDCDLELAIRKGITPMLTWTDPKKNGLPYFENHITGENRGNHHHASFSAAHMAGRRLEALTAAQRVTGERISPEVFDNLRFWAYKVFDNPWHVMLNLNLADLETVKVCDLHNFREMMYSFIGLLRINPEDQRALQGAKALIQLVDQYTDFDTGLWKTTEFQRDSGVSCMCGAMTQNEGLRFAPTLGRYIQALMRMYSENFLPEALDQALRLTNIFFRSLWREDGSYDGETFGRHLHFDYRDAVRNRYGG